MSPYTERILRTLYELNTLTGAPVLARVVVDHLGVGAERTAREHLRALEAMQIVHRPKGDRSGWKVRDTPMQLVVGTR